MSIEILAGVAFGLAGIYLIIKAFRERTFVKVPAHVVEVQEKTEIQLGGNPVLAFVTIEYLFEGKWFVVEYKLRSGAMNFHNIANLDSIYVDPEDRKKFTIQVEKSLSLPLGIVLIIVSIVIGGRAFSLWG